MIDLADIEKIALLARLELSPEKAREHAEQLPRVLKHFEQIAQVSTVGVEPLVTPTEIEAYWREDDVVQELTPDEILANAPDKIGHLFRVPPVI
ncbi:MAG: glutamyl-tRNA(Gln) amidotransferase [Pseudomonadota bacterium]|jgi:aspartyl-tRNA(Asn)/glutamyl-tRNA(Gln) amidotransferase subunit C